MSGRIVRPRLVIMSVDPGGKTGVCSGLYNLRRGKTTEGTLKRALEGGHVTVEEFSGEPWEQAHEIVGAWGGLTYRASVELGVSLEDCYLVFESFQLAQRNVELSPVQIHAAVMAMIPPEDAARVVMQTASQAKGYATNARLRAWGVWVPGDHKRDAWRHTALAVSRGLDGEL